MPQWCVGVDSWIIEDGNYWDFKVGEHRTFALEFDAKEALAFHEGSGPPVRSARRIEGSAYAVTAQVVFADGWTVIDFGVPAFANDWQMNAYHANSYRSRLLPVGVLVGDWVTGEIYLGIDPFHYFEQLAAGENAPALIYDWHVDRIEQDTTPFVLEAGAYRRDLSRKGWADVSTTSHPSAFPGPFFVMHCRQLETPPKYERGRDKR